ncbi:hypothetical protein A1O3_07098 [Capronia epimyces CBS 606.96]|uniref:Nucleoside phosphorylase domain-containing protein n=1 Tax=Capronia epimyces CBS 606.96 TaxID=1182542 RepID=W9YET6_9EURO|nr:uncharacterized protein A1O3_07098 [Capronia epimyces CBS 606.96]EXJ80814.1 hypothetical protein A1O3_07098 [Capronia epimyces CBS 606.96]
MPPPASMAGYRVGWICPLYTDMLAARAMLDEDYGMIRGHGQDTNTYAVGRIHDHYVVIAGLPAGFDGALTSASVVKDILRTFHELRFMMLVGIGAGIPNPPVVDIRLGDVVIGQPAGSDAGVVQFNRGKNIPTSRFERKGMLFPPSHSLLTALTAQRAEHELHGSRKICDFVAEMFNRYPNLKRDFSYPGLMYDRLFRLDYHHIKDQPTCQYCVREAEVPREARSNTGPAIHYGLIASGDQIIKDSFVREFIRSSYGAMCVEMEAPGLMHNFPGLIIKGISDYADSHRNERWHKYAAAAAAACTKELLHYVSSVKIEQEAPIQAIIDDEGSQYLEN